MTKEINRRGFFKKLGKFGLGAGAVVAAPALLPLSELKAATATAVKYAILVDTRKCVGCKACQVACKVWNDNEPDPETFKTDFTKDTWTFVQEDEVGYFNENTPNVKFITTKRQCMHCEDPVCVRYCPMNGLAIHKEADGPVLINHDNCLRCLSCVNSCPYGVPKFDSAANKVRKCVFCFGRLRKDEKPACVDTCVAGALQSGTLEEITALAQTAESGEYPVYGMSDGAKTSWIYIFPKGVDPEKIFNAS
jgi:formate dehydrogenase iron-sulfur subunit